MRMLRGRCYLAVVCFVLLSVVYGLYRLFNKFDSYYVKESPHSKDKFRQLFLFFNNSELPIPLAILFQCFSNNDAKQITASMVSAKFDYCNALLLKSQQSDLSKAFREHHGHGGVFYEPVVDQAASYPTRRTASQSEEQLQSNSSLISLTKSVKVIELTETQVFQQKSSAVEPSAVKPSYQLPADEFAAVKPRLPLPEDELTVVKQETQSPEDEPSAVKSEVRSSAAESSVVKSRIQLPVVEPSAGVPTLNQLPVVELSAGVPTSNTSKQLKLTKYEQFHEHVGDSTRSAALSTKLGTRRNIKSSVNSSSDALSRLSTETEQRSLVVKFTNRTLLNAGKQSSRVAQSQATMETERTLTRERRRLAQAKLKQMEDKVWFQQDVAEIMKGVKEGGVVELQKKPDEGPPAEVDPVHWEGLNSAAVYKRYPGIVLEASYVFNRSFFAPNDPMASGMQGNPGTVDDLTEGQAEDRFYQLISMTHVDCRLIQRMGSVNDGGWDLCTVPPFIFKPGCLVYSFGINYDFTFDDAMATAFNCTVKSFDPSMTVKDYVRSSNILFFQLGLGPENTVTDKGWKLMSLQSIRSKLGHSGVTIDVIKMDIDYNEWSCIQTMAKDGSLDNVKQLIFEIHTKEVETIQRPTSKEDFIDMYESLLALEQAGFRRYNCHYNTLGQYTSIRTGKTRSCCYELYYINIRFLKK